MHASIITARAGSKSILNKNAMALAGKPLVAYPIQASLDAELIHQVFISTDGDEIAECGEAMGCTTIWRPEELGGDSVNHGDVIKHAVEWVDERADNLENIVLLLGNTTMIDGQLIDDCLKRLDADSEIDSVMTVWEAADDHPLRALEIDPIDGLVYPYGNRDRDVSTERQSYKKAYYYDQGIWAFRKRCVQERTGPNPWWWMGQRCQPIIRTWMTGRDIHTQFDVLFHEHYVANRDRFCELEERTGTSATVAE
ncbi:MAG: hypothetical protein AAFX06_08625 [Planctomycetota bacterium]